MNTLPGMAWAPCATQYASRFMDVVVRGDASGMTCILKREAWWER